jgi:hypothetical protein
MNRWWRISSAALAERDSAIQVLDVFVSPFVRGLSETGVGSFNCYAGVLGAAFAWGDGRGINQTVSFSLSGDWYSGDSINSEDLALK